MSQKYDNVENDSIDDEIEAFDYFTHRADRALGVHLNRYDGDGVQFHIHDGKGADDTRVRFLASLKRKLAPDLLDDLDVTVQGGHYSCRYVDNQSALTYTLTFESDGHGDADDADE